MGHTITLRVGIVSSTCFSGVSDSPIHCSDFAVDILNKPKKNKTIGTGISMYGRKGPGGGILKLIFDGRTSLVDLNSDEPSSISTRLWNEAGLVDGDHQVFASTTTANDQIVANIVTNIWVDYFE